MYPFLSDVRNLGILLDSQLNYTQHVNRMVSHCHKIIKDVWKIRCLLTQSDAEKLVHAVISTKLDNCNSLYYGMSSKNMKKLQKVQNAAARLVCRTGRRDSVSQTIRNLHWLRVESRIVFKLLLFVHKSSWGCCSNNISDLVTYKNYCRSEDHLLLSTKVARTKHGKRAFSFIGPRLWNLLPLDIRTEENTECFKKRLKTLLFTETNEILNKALCYE